MRRMNAALVAALCAIALSGCSSIRDLAGLQKKSPDEFAVTTKAPLVIPPDFNLRPPMPGAPPAMPIPAGVATRIAAAPTIINQDEFLGVAGGNDGRHG